MVRRFFCITLMVVSLASFPARAQFAGLEAAMMAGASGQRAVTGTGSVVVRRQPTKLRMILELRGNGKSFEEALGALGDRREAAIVQLEALEADKETINFSDPTLSDAENDQQGQLQQMIRTQMLGRRRSIPKALKTPRSVVAKVTLSADWPLEEAKVEDLLMATETLKEKVKAANLSGAEDPKELSAEEQEMAEEMAQMMMNAGQQQAKIGAPQFFYVAEISEEDGDRALAEAFQKAKTQAARLAGAAGIGLGPLVGLSGQESGANAYGMDSYRASMMGFGGDYEQRQYLQGLLSRHFSGDSESRQNEAIGSEPGSLKFTFSVHAVFAVRE